METETGQVGGQEREREREKERLTGGGVTIPSIHSIAPPFLPPRKVEEGERGTNACGRVEHKEKRFQGDFRMDWV